MTLGYKYSKPNVPIMITNLIRAYQVHASQPNVSNQGDRIGYYYYYCSSVCNAVSIRVSRCELLVFYFADHKNLNINLIKVRLVFWMQSASELSISSHCPEILIYFKKIFYFCRRCSGYDDGGGSSHL